MGRRAARFQFPTPGRSSYSASVSGLGAGKKRVTGRAGDRQHPALRARWRLWLPELSYGTGSMVAEKLMSLPGPKENALTDNVWASTA